MKRRTGAGWRLGEDVLGEDFDVQDLALSSDYEGPVTARLVRYSPSAKQTRGAVLWVHGFADYYFHRHVAEVLTASGYAFYALDLRRYGRSLLPHQTPNFCHDLGEHFEELDAALEIVADEHPMVYPLAHSFGGLVVAHWWHQLSARQRSQVRGLVLNAPFLALPTETDDWLWQAFSRVAVATVARLDPFREVPRDGVRLYGPSLHKDSYGTWDYDLRWKPHDSFPIRTAWLAGVMRAQRSVRGRRLSVPTLVLTARRSMTLSGWTTEALGADVVLDVVHIRRIAASLGDDVEQIEVHGAVHDVTLSDPEALRIVFAELLAWFDRRAP